jgi:hypothetical protein
MAIKTDPLSAQDQLLELAELLESKATIPDGLRTECSAYIRAGLRNDGVLRLGGSKDKNEATWKRLMRAVSVVCLMFDGDRFDRNKKWPAISSVAADTGLSKWTIEKDYKNFRNVAIEITRVNRSLPIWFRALKELIGLLKTFKHSDGSNLSDNEVDAIWRELPPSMIQVYVDQITRYGPLRRDEKYLTEVFN